MTSNLRATELLPGQLPSIEVDVPESIVIRVQTDGGSTQTKPDLEVGVLLGEGGMGKVHLAYQRSLMREVAVKTLHTNDPVVCAALQHEALITSSLEHPGVVPVHALNVDATGAPVLVMKRVDGIRWADLISQRDHEGWRTRPGDRLLTHLDIFTRVAETVHFAHKRGVIHRDIKPENVLLGEAGETYLVDWGIATRLSALASTGVEQELRAGSPAYMAPEMVVPNRRHDVRTDVFLLGATLHEALTGESRNPGTTFEEVMSAAASPQPWSYGASVPDELAKICNRATACDPNDRFPTVDALRSAVAEFLRHRGSVILAAQAVRRVSALVELLKDPSELRPTDIRRAYRCANEARFAYEEALREWPENEVARYGRTHCAALFVELELRQGHIDAAEELLRELEPSARSPALVARVEAQRLECDDRTRQDERVRALAHEADPTVGARTRTILLATLALAYCALAGIFIATQTISTTKTTTMFSIALGLSLGSIALGVVFQKRLLANAFNRGLVGLLVAAQLSITLNRALAVMSGASLETMIRQDLLLLAAFSVATAVTRLRWMWIEAVLATIAIGISVWRPSLTLQAFVVASTVVPLVAALALARRTTESAR